MKENGNEIAVIGMSCRLPQANNVKEFWEIIKKGTITAKILDNDELIKNGVDPSILKLPNYVKIANSIEGLDSFDAEFFGISPKEAALIDPQHRHFLESTWEALESSGYDPSKYKGYISIFAGVGFNIYLHENVMPYQKENKNLDLLQVHFGNSPDFLTTRVSYLLNLKGPSACVQTACSSSLVSVHLACQSLLTGDSDIALAGGVSLKSTTNKGYLHQKEGILSEDGFCKPFDAKASGTMIGEGVGIVVLKRLSDALRDRDNIHAVIKGSSINNDGSKKISFYAPSIDCQTAVLLDALSISEATPERISYIETHGTGTFLGDPIEFEALKLAFKSCKTTKPFCALGSVKANIGHTDSASGILGLIKTVLCLKNKKIPPLVNFQHHNPKIDIESTPFYFTNKLQKWESKGLSRLAGVTSLGIGGTNAHVILEEAPKKILGSPSRSYQLITLSGKTKESITQYIPKFKNTIDELELDLKDVAYTFNTGRKNFSHRHFFLAKTTQDLKNDLNSFNIKQINKAEKKELIFLFPGQGASFSNLGRELYQQEIIFRKYADQCLEIIHEKTGRDFRSSFFSDNQKQDVYFSHLSIFLLEYSLGKLYIELGCSPDLLIGHSLGEYPATCLSGALSLEDALTLVIARGRSLSRAPLGGMLLVGLNENKVTPYLFDSLSLSGNNSENLTAISGNLVDIETLQKKLRRDKIFAKKIPVSHPFHSALLEPVLEGFKKAFKNIHFQSINTPIISTLKGNFISSKEIESSNYWLNQLIKPVRFIEAVHQAIDKLSNPCFLEVGPGNSLTAFLKSNPFPKKPTIVTSLPLKTKADSEQRLFLNSIGSLWKEGFDINWEIFYKEEKRNKVDLPPTCFKKEKHWITPNNKKPPPNIGISTQDQGTPFFEPIWKQKSRITLQKTTLSDEFNYLIFSENSKVSIEIENEFKENRLNYELLSKEDFFSTKTKVVQNDQNELFLKHINHWKTKKPFKILIFVQEKDFSFNSIKPENFGFFFLFYLIQNLLAKGLIDPLQVIIITKDLCSITGNESIAFQNAPILAMVKSLSLEFPSISFQHLDIEDMKTISKRDLSNIKTTILDSLINSKQELSIAIRGNYLWKQELQAISPKINYANKIKKRGKYLITGGLGGIGLEIAKNLSREFSADIILLSRRNFPSRKDWEQYLKQHHDLISKKITTLLDIEKNGSKVQVLKCDVANKKQMQKKLSPFNDINGIFHCAGIVKGEILENKNSHSISEVLAPKILGSKILVDIYKNLPIDFILLFSSNDTWQGTLGGLDYVAANTFLDYFALAINDSLPFSVQSIGWDSWKNVGMKQDYVDKVQNQLNEKTKELLFKELEDAISPEEGWEYLKQALNIAAPNIILFHKRNQATAFQDSKKPNKSTIKEKQNISQEDTERILICFLKDLLGYKTVDLHKSFFEMGGDSLFAIQLISRVNQEFEIEISIRDVFDNPSVNSLKNYIIRLIQPKNSATKSSSLKRVNRLEAQPLSLNQERIWFLDKLQKGNLFNYNVREILSLNGPLNLEKLSKAANYLVERHEPLRTKFIEINGECKQQVLPACPIKINYKKINKQNLDEELLQEIKHVFNIYQPPLFRLSLFKKGFQDYVLVINLHHIISDAWSSVLLLKELSAIYSAFLENRDPDLVLLDFQYVDFTKLQKKLHSKKQLLSGIQFWKKELKGVSNIQIQLDKPRPLNKISRVKIYIQKFTKSLSNSIDKLCKDHQLTPFMIHISILYLLLSKYSLEKDFAIGCTLLGRDHPNLEKMLGFFINTCSYRLKSENDLSFCDFLAFVKEKHLQIFQNQSVSFNEIVKELNIKRTEQVTPVFQVLLLMLNKMGNEKLEFSNTHAEFLNYNEGFAIFDLAFGVHDHKDKAGFYIQYNSDLFHEKTISQMSNNYIALLESGCRYPSKKSSELQFLDVKEEHHLIKTLNHNTNEIAKSKSTTVIDLFLQQVKKHPKKIALIFEGQKMTYGELDKLSKHLSSYIRNKYLALYKKNMPLELPIALCMDRSFDMIVAILGILKAGAYYVPIHPSDPIERQKQIIQESKCTFLLADENYRENYKFLDENFIISLNQDITKTTLANYQETKLKGNQLAYVLQTSGSTGKPKGVMIEHRSVLNKIKWFLNYFNCSKNDNFVFKSPINFDLSVSEIFVPLCCGAALAIAKPDGHKDLDYLYSLLKKEAVTHVQFIPSMLDAFLSYRNNFDLSNLRVITIGGEPLLKRHVKKIYTCLPDIDLYNLYGITEATVHNSFWKCPKKNLDKVLIGQPIDNTDFFVMDDFGQLLPQGCLGELYISGISLARGYLNNPDLTKKFFFTREIAGKKRDYIKQEILFVGILIVN